MLFAISCLGIAYFYFLGLGSLLLRRFSESSRSTQWNATFLVAGLSLHHALSLVLPRLAWGWGLGSVLAVAGLVLPSSLSWRERYWPYTWLTSLGVLATLICFTRHALSYPITEWDARSIWFFHAKIAYSLGSLQLPEVWTDPTIGFSHPTYPKLIPALGALSAKLGGSWNDYFPKLAFGFLALPVLFTLGSLKDRFWPLAWLWFALFLSQYHSLSYGYADGFHALYAGLALLFFAKGLDDKKADCFWQGASCLAVAAQIKSECTLVIAVLALLLAAYAVRRRPAFSVEKGATVAILFSGFAAWQCLGVFWGVSESVPLAGTGFATRVIDRSTTGIPVLLDRFFIVYKLGTYAGIFSVAALLSKFFHRRPLPIVLLAGAPALFTLGLGLIYLGTPHDFLWHVGTSIDRTALIPRAFLVVAAYLAFSRLSERQSGR